MSWIKSGGTKLEKAAFDDRARRAAKMFQRCGVREGDGVVLCLRNDLVFFEAAFGVGMLGAYSVLLNWHCTAAEAGYILRDSGAKVLVIHSDLLPQLGQAVPEEVLVVVVETPLEILAAYGIADPGQTSDLPIWENLLSSSEPFAGVLAVPPSSIIYTSGTTGKPKGVKRPPASPEQANSLARMLAQSYGYTEYLEGQRDPSEIVTAAIGPLYHTAPNTHAIFSLRIGANVIVEPRFDAERLLKLIESYGVTHLNMVPIMFVRLLRLPENVRRRYDRKSLRYVGHAAAPCPAPVKRAMIDWWGPIIAEYYGTTEMGNVTHITADEWLAHPGSVGRAMVNTDVKIIDENGKPVAPGVVGEVVGRRRGATDFTYQNDPAKRAAAEKGGLLAPGDIGYLDEEGYLYLCDRKADMIVSGGANIYPAEVESELLRLSGIADCAVFGIPDAEFGEAVMAVVQPVPGFLVEPADLRSRLRSVLSGYKIPRVIEIRDDLPREDSGKIFKRKLRSPYWEGHERSI